VKVRDNPDRFMMLAKFKLVKSTKGTISMYHWLLGANSMARLAGVMMDGMGIKL
jgi:hypothetical protein